MLYRKITKFIEDFYANSSSALLLTGARQTGKTYSFRDFGKKFPCFVEINFIETPEAVNIIRNASGAKDLLFRISALSNRPLEKGRTLVFFDEVQECPEVVTAIKFLVEEGSYRYALSGSLLGVELKNLRSEPVGFMGVKEMYPLDLEEFFINLGVSDGVITRLRENWNACQEVDEGINRKFLDLFRLYIVVGGMPGVVSKYLATYDLQAVLLAQQNIINLYRRDITKYAETDKLAIKEIFDLIPSELDAKNKRFILKSLGAHVKFDRYRDSFLWLKDAGVAIPVYNVEEPKAPLRLAETRNLFKLFSNDVGLLTAQYANGIQRRILAGDPFINFGSVFENAVAQELLSQGRMPYYYNNKHRGEIDFLISFGSEVVPVEVKSGKDYSTHRALANILDCEEWGLKRAVVLGPCNLKREGKITYAPIYMAMFLTPEELPLGIFRPDLAGLR